MAHRRGNAHLLDGCHRVATTLSPSDVTNVRYVSSARHRADCCERLTTMDVAPCFVISASVRATSRVPAAKSSNSKAPIGCQQGQDTGQHSQLCISCTATPYVRARAQDQYYRVLVHLTPFHTAVWHLLNSVLKSSIDLGPISSPIHPSGTFWSGVTSEPPV
jgi:hypothetical protein